MELNDEQNKQLMDFLMPPEMRQAPLAGPSPAPAGGATPPPLPPTDIQQKLAKDYPGMSDRDPGAYDKALETSRTAAPNDPSPVSATDPADKTVDSHPGLNDALTTWAKGQEKQVDAWGPEKQAALMQHLQEGYRSPGNVIAKGGATIADAIMQGVARAGDPGNLAAINERENQNLNRTAEMGKSLNEQNLAALKAKQGLEGMTSTTPLGSSEAAAINPVIKQIFPQMTDKRIAYFTQNPEAAAKALGPMAEIFKAQGQLAYEQGAREDTKIGQIAGRYNKPINDIQKNIDDLDSSLTGLRSGDLGQIASAQAIVSQALKLSPRLAREAGGQSFAAKLDQWSSGKFGNQSIPPELMKPVLNVLERQRQAYQNQKNNLVDQATNEGAAMRVDPAKIRSMFGPVGKPTTVEGNPSNSQEIERQTKDGKVAVFDATTKKFLRYK